MGKGLPASKTTLAKWIRSTIQESYLVRNASVPAGIKAHSIQSVSASRAIWHQASAQQLCKAATWSSLHTFTKHYHVHIQASADVALGRVILQTAVPQNPRLFLSEKALRLSYRHTKTERNLFCGFLLGSLAMDDDEEGITLTIYRFDPGREKSGVEGKVPSALLPGDIAIPCTVCLQDTTGGAALHTPEDFTAAFKGLQSHLHSKEALDLSKLLTLRAHITYSENMDNLHFDLRWAAVTVANTFESTPIKPVPIIPTALARNLSSHNNIAQLQGTHKCG
ncbi:unnamed protein product [Ranitomeya imitator]|uniref:STIL N-terminal domain-containing protein n=1 Tax=Ranitomeya imitator TaxID=111125 RepID=A0ABN9LY37_9NEOB|nr:unnamed protein product [Ranitomeya imitator]